MPNSNHEQEPQPDAQNEKLAKGAKLVSLAAKKIEKSDNVAETLAQAIMKAKSPNAQKMWDEWLSEDWQRYLVRADDRTFMGKLIEKWSPMLDPSMRNPLLNLPLSTLSNVAVSMAMYGIIRVDEKILDDMRGMPGTGIANVPDWAIGPVCAFFRIPQAAPILMAAKAVVNANEGLAKNVRNRVRSLEEENIEVADEQEVEHEAVADSTPDEVVAPH